MAKKIIRYKKPKNINIGMVVFAVIFLYLVIVLIQYAIKPRIKMYEVLEGDIANDSYYTGLILRTETVVNSEGAGYVNYYLQEKEKAAVGDLVYTVDAGGAVADYLNQSSGDGSRLSDEDLEELRDVLSSFGSSYQDERFYEVYDANSSLSSRLMEYVNLSALQEMAGAGQSLSLQKCTAALSGVIVYCSDGLESLTAEQVTADSFSQENYHKTVYSGGQSVENGSPVYKVITEDNWSVLIPLEEDEIEDYADVESVSVRFTKKGIEADAAFSLITGADGSRYGRLDFDKYMIQFAEDRFVDIEVKNSRAYGLKIPQTAITEKEAYKIPLDFLTTGGDSADEGFYRETEAGGVSTIEFISPDILREETNEDGESFCYVDMETLQGGDTLLLPDSNERFQVAETETLKGAYNINRGYAVFKYVDILDENSEYCIVRKNVAYSLRPYDHIVLNASMVSDQQIVR